MPRLLINLNSVGARFLQKIFSKYTSACKQFLSTALAQVFLFQIYCHMAFSIIGAIGAAVMIIVGVIGAPLHYWVCYHLYLISEININIYLWYKLRILFY